MTLSSCSATRRVGVRRLSASVVSPRSNDSPAPRRGNTLAPMRRFGPAAAMVVAALACSRAGRADEAEARRLFERGRAELAEKKFDAACEKLERSYKLGGSAGAILSWADCEES